MAVWSRLALALGRNLTLGNLLDRIEKAHGPDGLAHVAEAQLDYKNLVGPGIPRRTARAFVARCSSGLIKAGVKRDEHVIVLAGNRVDTLYAIFAIARAGAIAVPLHALAREKDLAAVAEKTGATTVLIDPALHDEIKAREAAPAVTRWIFMGPERNVPKGELSLDALAAQAAPDAPGVERTPEDVAVLLFTS